MNRFNNKDYDLLNQTQRFTDIDVEFMGKAFKAPDSASLLFLNRELFGLEIYKFKAKSDKPYIIDAGANIGLSIIYFKQLYPHANVVAFEPDKKIFSYLEHNIESFEYSDVELINKGLWDEETTLQFLSEGADGGRVAYDSDSENIVEIETTLLSPYIKDRTVDFLKMDIEGSETRVLEECKYHLKNVENIYIEYHSKDDEPQTLSEILSILSKSGFRYYIEHIGVKSKHPYINVNVSAGFDSQLHIWGYRK